jgi:hypothetical protein
MLAKTSQVWGRRLFIMEEKLIVFISSRINDEMKRARQAVREAIAELPLTRPWLFEEAPAAAARLDESYLRWVGKCDLFILLLGEDITDPVRTEWETATQARKPRLVFLRKGAQDDAAWAFAKGLDVKWKEYRTLAELKREVQAAVGDELIKGYRAYGMSENERAGLQEHVRGLQAGDITIGGDVVFGDKVGGDKVAGDKVVVTTQVRDVRGGTVITAGGDVTYTAGAADDDLSAIFAAFLQELQARADLSPQDKAAVEREVVALETTLKSDEPDLGTVQRVKRFFQEKGGWLARAGLALLSNPSVVAVVQAATKRLMGG